MFLSQHEQERLLIHVAAEVADHWDDFPALYRRMTPRIVRALATGRLHVEHGLIFYAMLRPLSRWVGLGRRMLLAMADIAVGARVALTFDPRRLYLFGADGKRINGA